MREVVKIHCHPFIKHFLLVWSVFSHCHFGFFHMFLFAYCSFSYQTKQQHFNTFSCCILKIKTLLISSTFVFFSLLFFFNQNTVYYIVHTAGAYFLICPQQIRKLRRELESSQEKVADLTMQLNSNVCMIPPILASFHNLKCVYVLEV